LVLGVSDQFAQSELTGLLEVVLQDGIALSDALAEEKGFLLFFILKFFFVKF
jgi:hypothetical protein